MMILYEKKKENKINIMMMKDALNHYTALKVSAKITDLPHRWIILFFLDEQKCNPQTLTHTYYNIETKSI